MIEAIGFVEPGFEEVREVFLGNFEKHDEVGASVCVYLNGRPVVDLTGGTTTDGRPYDENSLQLVFSTTKGMTAVCAHMLAQAGDLDFDVPVIEYWPEFGDYGKGNIPVSWLLSHRSGLVDTSMSLTLDEALDWDTVTAALAASKPLWEPGTQHGYHAITYGWLVGEIIRRVSGMGIGEYFQTHIADRLGLDFWVGLPEEQHHRVARLIPMGLPGGMGLPDQQRDTTAGDSAGGGGKSFTEMLDSFLGPGNLLGRALTAPGGALGDQGVWNEPRIWSAAIPSANGIGNARSIARVYSACIDEVDGQRLLNPDTLDRALVQQVSGPDSVLMMPIPFGLGFMLHSEFSGFSTDGSFGHYGAGGSLGFADPGLGIGFGYVMNKMQLSLAGDKRTGSLIAAVKRSVARI